MKKLSRWMSFDFTAFSKGKKYIAVKQPEIWVDYNTKDFMGSKVTVEVDVDETPATDDALKGINVGETFTVKIRGVEPENLSWIDRNVELKISCEHASIWGEYKNNLTVIGTVEPVDNDKKQVKQQ